MLKQTIPTLTALGFATVLFLTLVPGVAADDAGVNPIVKVEPDRQAPEDSGFFVQAGAYAHTEEASVGQNLELRKGTYYVCKGFTCVQREGIVVDQSLDASAAGQSVLDIEGDVVFVEDDSDPTGYRLEKASLQCHAAGDPCPLP